MKHYLYAMGAILCWASLPAATGAGLQGLSTEELLFFSFTSAAVVLYAQDVLATRSLRLYIPNLKTSLLGVWGIFLYHYVYYLALDATPLAEGAILTTTWSFWIVVFSSVLMFRRVKPLIVLTAALGLLGAALVVSAGKEVHFTLEYMHGYLLALACGLIWSSFSVTLGRMKTTGDPMTAFTVYAAALSTGMYWMAAPHELPEAKALLSAVYLGCVPLGLSFYLWNRAVTGGNMVIIGFLSYLTPPLAVVMVALIHGERVPAQILVGMGIIIAASVLGKQTMKSQHA